MGQNPGAESEGGSRNYFWSIQAPQVLEVPSNSIKTSHVLEVPVPHRFHSSIPSTVLEVPYRLYISASGTVLEAPFKHPR